MLADRRSVHLFNFHSTFRLMLLLALAVWSCGLSSAMEPPRKNEIARYKADGTLAKRHQQARLLANNQVSPKLLYDFAKRNGALRRGMAPPTGWQGGLPATGSPKVLVLLVDFPDVPSNGLNSPAYVRQQMFGTAEVGARPYESLTNYYRRASYGALNIRGNVLGWYRAKHSRRYYEKLGFGPGEEALIAEAIQYYDARGHDFSQYDSDHDGTIDSLFVKWTGPDNGWANFWWAYQWSWNATDPIFADGKRVGHYVWSWIANPGYDGAKRYAPKVDIHETGHLLGLPDLYDYDASVGPGGGVGWLDMMDDNWGDHNAFSKAMLGWLKPQVVGRGQAWKSLAPSGSASDAVLIMPGASGDIFGEFFMVQYRKKGVGNDPLDYPASGMTIWHVDATLTPDGSDFLYDNSYTAHKYLRLMEADGLEHIETGSGPADSGDFYVRGKTFTPLSMPNSSDYAGLPTGVTVSQFAVRSGQMRAYFAVTGAVGAALAPAALTANAQPAPPGP